MIWVAIDFETADSNPDSACAVALVRVDNGEIVRKESSLIRPPREMVTNTGVHGLTWKLLRNARSFKEVWENLLDTLSGATALVAHNATFDSRVLSACCEAASIPTPKLQWVCTLRMAQRRWPKPNRLPDVCARLGIPFTNHHDASADAMAAAQFYLELLKETANEIARTDQRSVEDTQLPVEQGGRPGHAGCADRGSVCNDVGVGIGQADEVGVRGPSNPDPEAISTVDPGNASNPAEGLLARVKDLGGSIEIDQEGKTSLKCPTDPAARAELIALAPQLREWRESIIELLTVPTECSKCGGTWYCPPAVIFELASSSPHWCDRAAHGVQKDAGRVVKKADKGCPFKR